MFTKEEVIAAQKSFEEEFWKPPWEKYISCVGTSTIGLWSEDDVSEDQKDLPCIAVGLVKKLPKKIVFPMTHRGVPVALMIVGRIRAFSC